MLGIILAITAGLFWGTSAIFARLGMQGIRASTGTFISILPSAVLVCSLALIIDYDAVLLLTPKVVLWFCLVGFVNFFLGRQCNYTSIRYIGVGSASAIFASSPLFAIIIAVIFIGERVNIPIIIGTLFTVVGLYFVITNK